MCVGSRIRDACFHKHTLCSSLVDMPYHAGTTYVYECNANNGENHCIPTHLNVELDVLSLKLVSWTHVMSFAFAKENESP